ncbi:MAG: fibrillarin [Thermoplasmata archaeon HGW-Thermoplasmata-1]|nr:MAG: fibrillarin [Thermoplasmata archaeon HGW-Thermoplasmata-1]
MIKPSRFQNVFADREKLFTRNLNESRGHKVYGEKLVLWQGKEYRAWNPRRSKLGAAVLKGCRNMPIKSDSRVLYLGAANGTTPSHVSDVARDGMVYALEFSPRSFRDLLKVSEIRPNLIPILGDANRPEDYAAMVGDRSCDVVYQDIAQRNQAGIFIKNCRQFLKAGGYGILMLKSRSVDVSREPREVFAEVAGQLEKAGLSVFDILDLEPFEIDHAAIFVEK